MSSEVDDMTRPTTHSEKIAWIRGYFLDTVVKGYMVGDLRRMLEIEICPGQFRNCNFPIALYTFACTDYLGYLISEKKLGRSGRDTGPRIKAYIDGTFTEQHKKELDESWSGFVNVFRHGLAHEFFPKMAGVSRVKGKLLTWSKQDGYWVLDADCWAKAFIESVSTLESLMEEDDTCARMYDRYMEFLTPTGPTMSPPTHTTTSSTLSSDKTTTPLLPDLESGDVGCRGDNGMQATATSEGDTDTGVAIPDTRVSRGETGPPEPSENDN